MLSTRPFFVCFSTLSWSVPLPFNFSTYRYPSLYLSGDSARKHYYGTPTGGDSYGGLTLQQKQTHRRLLHGARVETVKAQMEKEGKIKMSEADPGGDDYKTTGRRLQSYPQGGYDKTDGSDAGGDYKTAQLYPGMVGSESDFYPWGYVLGAEQAHPGQIVI